MGKPKGLFVRCVDPFRRVGLVRVSHLTPTLCGPETEIQRVCQFRHARKRASQRCISDRRVAGVGTAGPPYHQKRLDLGSSALSPAMERTRAPKSRRRQTGQREPWLRSLPDSTGASPALELTAGRSLTALSVPAPSGCKASDPDCFMMSPSNEALVQSPLSERQSCLTSGRPKPARMALERKARPEPSLVQRRRNALCDAHQRDSNADPVFDPSQAKAMLRSGKYH
jgi:hypothetical protein